MGQSVEVLEDPVYGSNVPKAAISHDQPFKSGELGTKFKPYSKYPPCYKDISFRISDQFTENNLCEVVRGIAGDLAEEVVLMDEFTNPKKGLTSHCYRTAYRSMERSLMDDEINELQLQVREQVESKLKVPLR